MTQASPIYVYIAADRDGGPSFVDTTPSLLEMPWIVRYGVDNLVWFTAAEAEHAEILKLELRTMSEERRTSVFTRYNPDRLDLTPRIWGSDPED